MFLASRKSTKTYAHIKFVPNSDFFGKFSRIFSTSSPNVELIQNSHQFYMWSSHVIFHVNNWNSTVHHKFTNTTSLPSFVHVHRIQMRKPNKATTLIPAKQLLTKISPQLTDDFTMFRLRLVQRIVRFFSVAPWFRANSTSTSQLTQKYALFFVEKTAWPLWPIRIDFSLFRVP